MKKLLLPVILLICSSHLFSQHNVTFQLDMNNVSSPFITPEVNGTFNGWCGNCASMTDVNNDNIWEITFPLAVRTTCEFFSK